MDYVSGKRKDILKDICKRLNALNETLYKKHLENPDFIPYDLFSELGSIESTLEHIILPYYERMGTQKSFARATASRANGKKGGRPPKRITELKKRLEALDESTDTANEQERRQIKIELERITQEWEEQKHGAKNDCL